MPHLAVVPVVAVVLLRQPSGLLLAAALAAPWYARNLALYASVAGTVESRSGLGIAQALGAFTTVPWMASAGYLARATLWTGNNSFVTFSQDTLNVVCAVLLVGVVLAIARRWRLAEMRIVLAYVAIFIAALAYSTAVSFVFTQGASASASPWYAQFLYPSVLVLAWLGLRKFGVVLLLLYGYLVPVTYFGKLIPLYAWDVAGKVSMEMMRAHYGEGYAVTVANLDLVCLAPGEVVMSLAAVTAGMAMAIPAVLISKTNLR